MKQIDNAIIVSASVKSGEETTIKCGDVVYFSSEGITKTAGTLKNFGVVVDDNEDASRRNVCIYGRVKLPKTGTVWFKCAPFFLASGVATFGIADNENYNGIYIDDEDFFLLSNHIYTKT
ncbi:MAG: hypothetical protein GYA62_15125 [Bacteroidales bacterium]|nr:hypothetical protein [Bacteroidales bacterium]